MSDVRRRTIALSVLDEVIVWAAHAGKDELLEHARNGGLAVKVFHEATTTGVPVKGDEGRA